MKTTHHTILFDGECNFCSFWVKYVIKNDPNDQFRFAPLQSSIGKGLLKQHNIDKAIDSVVYIEHEIAYIKSTASFRILKTLGGFKSIFYAFIIIPEPIRNFIYDLMAKYRYRIFGSQTCELPLDNNYSHKFLKS